MNKKRKILVAIDSNAIIHRAYHAYPKSLTVDGMMVNALYGFASMLLYIIDRFKPDYTIACFDSKEKTFRHAEYADYKANRKPLDTDLIHQFKLVEESLEAFNIPQIKIPGYEADDILGTLSRLVQKEEKLKDTDVYIVSADRDLLQLIDSTTKVVLSSGNFSNMTIYDRDLCKEKYGYLPEQVVDLKALAGDSSDNIPGIKGFGEKGVISMLEKFNTLEGIYSNLDKLPQKKAEALREGSEIVALSKRLATISLDAPITTLPNNMKTNDYSLDDIINFLNKYKFRSLISKATSFNSTYGQGIFEDSINDNFTLNINELVGLDTDYDELDSSSNRVNDKTSGLFDKEIKLIDMSKTIVDAYIIVTDIGLYKTNRDSVILKILDDYKNRHVKIDLFDNLVDSSYTRIPTRGTKKFLGDLSLYSGILWDIDLLANHFNSEIKNFDDYAISREYNVEISKLDIAVVDIYNKQLELSKGRSLPDGTEINCYLNELIEAVKQMSKRGVRIDPQVLDNIGQISEQKMSEYKEKFENWIGHEVNMNSSKQMQYIVQSLFERAELRYRGKISSKESILDYLVDYFPEVESVILYRRYSKIKSTYVEGFRKFIREEGCCKSIHSTFVIDETSTGRLASQSPNMQNLPIKDEYDFNFRNVFISRDGFNLVSFDYSQMEFRVLAYLSEDPVLLQIFDDGLDLHAQTAKYIFDTTDISKEQRSLGKKVNFGVIYGQTEFGLAKLLGIDVGTAKIFINKFFNSYKGLQEYYQSLENIAREKGFIETLFGRRRFYKLGERRNSPSYKNLYREMINFPVQGGAADIVKFVMVLLQRLINQKYKDKCYMIMQVHDELVFEVKQDLVDEFIKDATKIASLEEYDLPHFKIEFQIGNNLGELK